MESRTFLYWKIFLAGLCLIVFGWWYFDLSTVLGWSFFIQPVKTSSYSLDSTIPSVQNDQRVFQTYTINGKSLKVEIASDQDSIRQGLSDRVSMGQDEGMLFLMPSRDIYAFWMNRMQFPLDMVWIDNGLVVEIASQMPPPALTGGVPKTYFPKVSADMVLELNAGGVEFYGIKVGDKLDF